MDASLNNCLAMGVDIIRKWLRWVMVVETIWANSQIFRCNKEGFEPICMNYSFSAIAFQLNFNISIAFGANNFVWSRPFWGQFLIFAEKTVFLEQNELMHQKIMGAACKLNCWRAVSEAFLLFWQATSWAKGNFLMRSSVDDSL
jgi:hypothetical protein